MSDATEDRCPAMLLMYDGEYEGECELPAGHQPPHWDGQSTWRDYDFGSTDPDTINLPEDMARRGHA